MFKFERIKNSAFDKRRAKISQERTKERLEVFQKTREKNFSVVDTINRLTQKFDKSFLAKHFGIEIIVELKRIHFKKASSGTNNFSSFITG